MEIKNCIRKPLITIKVKSNTTFPDQILNFAKSFQSTPSSSIYVLVGLDSLAVKTLSASAHISLTRLYQEFTILEYRTRTTKSSYYQNGTKLIRIKNFPVALLLYGSFLLTEMM